MMMLEIGNSKTQISKINWSKIIISSASEPETANPEKCLLSDLKALVELMRSKTYPILIVDFYKLQYVKYGFWDASGEGFGVAIEGEVVLDI